MKKYSLWFDNFKDVQTYEIKFLSFSKELQNDAAIRRHYKICNRLSFQVNGEIRDKFSIEEIDSLLTGYTSEDDFRRALSTYSKNYNINSKFPLIATYKLRDEVKQLDLVYNSSLLQKYALLQRSRKKKKITDKKLPKSNELQQFYQSLLRFVENTDTRELVFHPLQQPYNISMAEAQGLNQLLPPAIPNTSSSSLRKVLEEYSDLFDLCEQKRQDFLPAMEEEYELRIKRTKIYDMICKDYQTLRKTILFMQRCQNIVQREKERQEENLNYQLSFAPNSENQLYVLNAEAQKQVDYDLQMQEEYQAELFQFSRELEQKRKEKYGDGTIEEDEDNFFDYEEDYAFSKVRNNG